MTRTLKERLFVLAGLSNILGVLICSKLFTNDVMMQTQPAVMGAFGLVMIIVWGLAYIAVSKSFQKLRWLIGVFVIEKLCYVIAWLIFASTQSLGSVYEANVLAGVFFSVYGLNDFAFMIFFAYIFITSPKRVA